jgi:nucleoside-diphosphate-sugar epimerase
MSPDADEKFDGKQLVIFGCGYIGAAVATEALARGMRVTALTRNLTDAHLLREQGIEVVVADLAGFGWHAHVPRAPEFALNCVSAGAGGLEAYRRSYQEGMNSIVGWARERGPVGTLVYTSSTSVYPQGGGVVVDEASPTSDAHERAAILLQAEKALREAADAVGRWFILRVAGIYGPGRHHVLDQVTVGEIHGVGEHHLNLAHRHDIAAAILCCFGAPSQVANEVFNVADDEPARKDEVVRWLAETMKVAMPRFSGEPHQGRRALTPDRRIANGKLKAMLDWAPRYPSFRDGYATLLSR